MLDRPNNFWPILFGRNYFSIIKKMRQAGVDAHITLGGHYPTFNHSDILRDFPEVNSVVRGEGEETLKELVSALENGSDFRNIAGLSFRRGERVIINAARDLNQDLDSLPFPARDLIPRVLEKSPTLSLLTSRAVMPTVLFVVFSRSIDCPGDASIAAGVLKMW